jgi:hypothetical protein
MERRNTWQHWMRDVSDGFEGEETNLDMSMQRPTDGGIPVAVLGLLVLDGEAGRADAGAGAGNGTCAGGLVCLTTEASSALADGNGRMQRRCSGGGGDEGWAQEVGGCRGRGGGE